MVNIPRLRMFAGPNGSGKSTIKSVISPELLGDYINPDEIEAEIRVLGYFDFEKYNIDVVESEVVDFFRCAALINQTQLSEFSKQMQLNDNKLYFFSISINSYIASILSDFLRQKLLALGRSFTFETVMSSPDKVSLLKKAQELRFRTYLYYVMTDDPLINISRIQHRVKMGGHDVPKDKIMSRYERSLGLLHEAVRYTNRAYIFDNSGQKPALLAEVTEGKTIELKTELIPNWFKQSLLGKL